jgi:hypothetical protein
MVGADWTGGKDDDLSFAFCEKYLFYALPVRWQSLTGQWAKGSSLDDDLSYISVRNIYSILYL